MANLFGEDLLKLSTAHEYNNLAKFHNGDVTEDTIDALHRLANIDKHYDEHDSGHEIFSQLAAEDELCDIYDNLHQALKMNKPEMLERIKTVLAQIEDKNSEFCNRQGYAATLLPKDENLTKTGE